MAAAPAAHDTFSTEAISQQQHDLIEEEMSCSAHNYHPLPVVIRRGEGVFMWDVEGRKYFDFLSAYSAVNQGHQHPHIIKALIAQAQTLPLTSRAFHNDKFGKYARFVTQMFGYDRVLPMNTGVEAGESAVKLARKWAYLVKKVPENEAVILFAKDNFWGRSIAACSSSTDPDCYTHFGPFTPNLHLVNYDDLASLEAAFKANPNVAAFYVEPIQGEAGVKIPAADYFQGVRRLCDEYKVLFIVDEIQTGIARTGKMLAIEHWDVRPDVVVLGKALSGGVYPVSAVLADDEVLGLLKPGQHGSTYGGNPLGCAVATAALEVVRDEKLVERAESMGQLFRDLLAPLKELPFVKEIRGKGLLNAVECDAHLEDKVTAWKLCLEMRDAGLLAKQTHSTIIRFAPPLTITEQEVREAVAIIVKCFNKYA